MVLVAFSKTSVDVFYLENLVTGLVPRNPNPPLPPSAVMAPVGLPPAGPPLPFRG